MIPIEPVQIYTDYAEQLYSVLIDNFKILADELLPTVVADSAVLDVQPRRTKGALDKAVAKRKKPDRDKVQQVAVRTNKHVVTQFQRAIQKRFGAVVLPQSANKSGGVINDWVDLNVQKIDDITIKKAQQLQDIIVDSVQRGIPISEVSKKVAAALKIEKERAARIAQDQVGSLNALLRKEQAVSIGVKKFVWRSLEDKIVRPVHKKANGKKYSYAKGHPTEVLPGLPIACRCYDDPILDDLLKL